MFDEREDFMVKLFGIKTASEMRYNYFSSSVGNLPAFSASFLSWDVVRLSNFFISSAGGNSSGFIPLSTSMERTEELF